MLRVVRWTSGPAVLALFLSLLSPANAGAQQWLQLGPAGGPTPRTGQSAVLDPNTQEMIVFGGLASANGQPTGSADVNDTWVLQLGANPQWRQLPSLPGNARDEQSAIYDPATTNMIIFGGKNSSGACFSDTWMLTGATGANPTWTQLATGPAARAGASAIYDSFSNRMIVFGGRCNTTLYNDVWVLSNANGSGGTPAWTQLTPSGTAPSSRGYDSAVYDPNTNSMIIFGGTAVPQT